jgi:hypothetical protein
MPAAATLTRISPSPGAGTGFSRGTSMSGPPGSRIAIEVIDFGNPPFGMSAPFQSASELICPPPV